MDPTMTMIALSGRPHQVGKVWGTINKDAIISDLKKHYLKKAKKKNISEETLIERSRKFIKIAGKIAPHWLEEAEAIAKTVELDKDLYTSFIANVYRDLFLYDECTSYAVSQEFTHNRAIFFHKNRDNVKKKQSAFVVKSSLKGINKFIAISDASVIACMMMVNEKGLAGSADTDGLGVKKPKYRGLMNTSILRYIAEKAATCEEALDIIQDFVKRGYYAGGEKTGTHWLFVDKYGKVLEISNNSNQVSFKYHKRKVYFSAREESRAVKALINAKEPIDFHLFHSVSRDSSICFSDSISGMTVEIDKQHPDLLTRAWISFPAKSLSFPIFMGAEKTPLCLLNGEAYSRGKRVARNRSLWEGREKESHMSAQLLEERALKSRKRKASAKLFDSWVQKQADGYWALLQSLK